MSGVSPGMRCGAPKASRDGASSSVGCAAEKISVRESSSVALRLEFGGFHIIIYIYTTTTDQIHWTKDMNQKHPEAQNAILLFGIYWNKCKQNNNTVHTKYHYTSYSCSILSADRCCIWLKKQPSANNQTRNCRVLDIFVQDLFASLLFTSPEACPILFILHKIGSDMIWFCISGLINSRMQHAFFLLKI